MRTLRLTKWWVFFLVVLFIYQFSYSEEGETKKKREILRGHYLSIGGATISENTLNRYLYPLGFKAPKDWGTQLGVGFFARKKLVFEMEFNGILGKKREWGSNVTKLSILTSSVNFGYNVLPRNHVLSLYPYIGSGFGRTFLELNQEKATLSEAVNDEISKVKLDKRNYTIRAGLGFDADLSKKHKNNKKMNIGFRVGYQFDVSDKDDWYFDKVKIDNVGSLRASGVYAKLIIGRSRDKVLGECNKWKCKNKSDKQCCPEKKI
jgi:hypothetical protein